MGLSLTIKPIKPEQLGKEYKGMLLGYNRLEIERDYRVFSQLVEIDGSKPSVPTHPLPQGIELWNYGDDGIEKRRNDPYGKELRYALAGDIKKLLKWPTEDMPAHNQAVKAFLEALPEDHIVILYWH